MIVWYGRLAGRDRALDREAGAAVLEDHPGPGRVDARTERLVEALDERHGHPLAVDRAEVDGAAGRLAHVAGDVAAALVEVGGIDQAAHVRPVAHVRERILQPELRTAD